MIRRALCENYIKTLFLERPGRDPEEVQSLLDGMMLDYPGLHYLTGLMSNLRPPEYFNLKKLSSRDTRDFLIREELLDYFENEPDMRKAREILGRPRAKEFMESMLLGRAPHIAIARRLVDMYKMRNVSLKCIKLYYHYYFNLELLDSTETRAIFTLKAERLAQSEDAEERIHGRALQKAYYSDPRRTAASMPHSPISSMIAQLQLGFMPSTVDLKQLTEMSEALTYCRLTEALATGSREFDRQALNLSTTARILQELKESKLRPEEELRKQLQTLTVKTAQGALPLANEVTGGRHTVDLVALPTSKESDERPGKK